MLTADLFVPRMHLPSELFVLCRTSCCPVEDSLFVDSNLSTRPQNLLSFISDLASHDFLRRGQVVHEQSFAVHDELLRTAVLAALAREWAVGKL